MLAAIESMLATYTAPLHPDLPPLQGGLMGFLGYDVVREIENLPNVPPEDRDLPEAVMSMIGSLAAFDHWRQRCYMIESVPVAGLDKSQRDAAYDNAVTRVQKGIEDLARPLAHSPVEPPHPDDTLSIESSMPNGMYERAVEVAMNTSALAIFSRSCYRSALTLNSKPIHLMCIAFYDRSTQVPICIISNTRTSRSLVRRQNHWCSCETVE